MDNRAVIYWKTKLKEKHRYNTVLTLYIILIIAGYGIFLTSKLWLWDSSELVNPSKLNNTWSWEDREVTLLEWDYAKDQKMMEVQINVKNLSVDGINQYTFSALDRDKGYFPTEVVINENGFIVVRITGIDEKWSQISLRMNLDGKEDVTPLKMYTNKEAVAMVDNIEDLTFDGYMIEKLNNIIALYNEEISSLNIMIEEQQNVITNCNANIAALEAEKEYQTDQEQSETLQLISKIQGEIQTAENNIGNYQAEIEEYQKRIENAKLQINNYQ